MTNAITAFCISRSAPAAINSFTFSTLPYSDALIKAVD